MKAAQPEKRESGVCGYFTSADEKAKYEHADWRRRISRNFHQGNLEIGRSRKPCTQMHLHPESWAKGSYFICICKHFFDTSEHPSLHGLLANANKA